MVQKIEYIDTLGKGYFYIDTRTPKEFREDHIPEALNIPIFGNEERALVGTIYTKIGKEKAFDEGYKIYQKKLKDIKKELLKHKDKTLVIYCWRGGLRSRAITELAESMRIRCYQLDCGYKKYRAFVRKTIHEYRHIPKLIVLHGLTGSGKTEIIRKIKDSIDLEGLAQHRSSVFGAIGKDPRSQKMFESLLLHEMESKKGKKMLVVEGESRKIGNIIIPKPVFDAMKSGINIRINCSDKARVERLKRIYLETSPDVLPIIKSIDAKLGKKTSVELKDLFCKKDHDGFTSLILEKYYDPLYRHSIEELTYEQTISDDDTTHAADKIKRIYGIS